MCRTIGPKYRAAPAPESYHLPLLRISALARHRQLPQHSPAKRSVRIFWLPAYACQLTLATWCRMGGRVGPFGVFRAAMDVTAKG